MHNSALGHTIFTIKDHIRDIGNISNLRGGARHFEGTFFHEKKGAFSKNKRGTSLFIAKS